jgi:hypothetical protein
MDFMVSLPPSRGFGAIMVVVDRFSKMSHFIRTKDEAMAQEIGRLFFTRLQAPWPPKGHSFRLRPKVHKQVLASFVEVYGVGTQDEHFVSPPNRWIN